MDSIWTELVNLVAAVKESTAEYVQRVQGTFWKTLHGRGWRHWRLSRWSHGASTGPSTGTEQPWVLFSGRRNPRIGQEETGRSDGPIRWDPPDSACRGRCDCGRTRRPWTRRSARRMPPKEEHRAEGEGDPELWVGWPPSKPGRGVYEHELRQETIFSACTSELWVISTFMEVRVQIDTWCCTWCKMLDTRMDACTRRKSRRSPDTPMIIDWISHTNRMRYPRRQRYHSLGWTRMLSAVS